MVRLWHRSKTTAGMAQDEIQGIFYVDDDLMGIAHYMRTTSSCFIFCGAWGSCWGNHSDARSLRLDSHNGAKPLHSGYKFRYEEYIILRTISYVLHAICDQNRLASSCSGPGNRIEGCTRVQDRRSSFVISKNIIYSKSNRLCMS